ncbi:MAG: SMP-30/gluconolactonase/LRE family protein [Rhizobiales bacterium]|nr:SMP-30/gluconolactonase/LRE family protein [Hyphomicrobiales bacterium]
MLTDWFETWDDRFLGLAYPNVHAEKLYEGCRWAEGPAYFAAGRFLLWSDIPNDRILRWDETNGVVSTFRHPCGYTNGHAIDLEGRLVSCEHGGRCVSRTEHDGSRTVLADRFEGRRLNSPNDVVVKSDGSIWFTDPSYGIESEYEGHIGDREIDGCHVYRIDPQSGETSAVATDFERPNGLAFSPDERRLYIVDSGFSHGADKPRHIRVFDIADDGCTLSGGAVIANCQQGIFDGLRLDMAGNLWVGAGDGVHCLASDGAALGRISLPEAVANVCFGGPKQNRLFICATRCLYAVYLNVQGAVRR